MFNAGALGGRCWPSAGGCGLFAAGTVSAGVLLVVAELVSGAASVTAESAGCRPEERLE